MMRSVLGVISWSKREWLRRRIEPDSATENVKLINRNSSSSSSSFSSPLSSTIASGLLTLGLGFVGDDVDDDRLCPCVR
jgi:hypothetical protein